jgi:hypothetical protein
MDISGLTGSAAGGFTGFGGMSSLPAGVQSKLMVQSQALNLLPSISVSGASPSGLGGNLDIYAAVGQQTLGALSGRSSVELAELTIAGRGGEPASAPEAASGDSGPAQTSGPKDPPLGSALDAILKEDGFVPQENPYAFRKDFFADQGSLGGLLNFLG